MTSTNQPDFVVAAGTFPKLSELPPELQLKIWEQYLLAIDFEDRLVHHPTKPVRYTISLLRPALLRASSAIRKDALPLYLNTIKTLQTRMQATANEARSSARGCQDTLARSQLVLQGCDLHWKVTALKEEIDIMRVEMKMELAAMPGLGLA